LADVAHQLEELLRRPDFDQALPGPRAPAPKTDTPPPWEAAYPTAPSPEADTALSPPPVEAAPDSPEPPPSPEPDAPPLPDVADTQNSDSKVHERPRIPFHLPPTIEEPPTAPEPPESHEPVDAAGPEPAEELTAPPPDEPVDQPKGAPDPFSVEEIEAEFARLLGRPVEKPPKP
jgi:hypothetical protein